MPRRRAPRLESVLHTLAVGALAVALANASRPPSAPASVVTPSPAAAEVEERNAPMGGAPLARTASHVVSPGCSGGLGKDRAARLPSEPSRPALDAADLGTPGAAPTSRLAHRTDRLPQRTTGPPRRPS